MHIESILHKAQEEWNAFNSPMRPLVLVGAATCGRSAGSLEVIEAFREESRGLGLDIDIIETGCIGLCYAEPIVSITKPSGPTVFYGDIDEGKARRLVNDYIIGDNPHPDYALGAIGDEEMQGIPRFLHIPVLKHQVRQVIRNCGFIDPSNINHYIANDGYSGFWKALKQDPRDLLNEIKKSGLRGRGGAGFPTWRKWQFSRDTDADVKYLICNADEGDPGAFMNRSVIEGDPHSLIEGMLIAGFTLGAAEGFIYCRAEYPLALERLHLALDQAREYEFLGKDILGSGFDYNITIKEGAGAFVCGEETALIASIEGKRGMPRPRPPFPAVSGLWGKPTIINNVETLVSVARILQYGADWFGNYGTEKSRGTKTISLVGKVKRTGLIEVPMGITLREVIFDIGGGILDDKPFKSVQTGGPSGGCIPVELLDIPIDYDSLAKAGSIMGSGGMVVMDEDNCMVDFARYFLDFASKESCGECVPCRLGTSQLLQILEDITEGKGQPDDIDLLMEIGEGIKAGSLCGLGQTAPNPVLSTLRYFMDEYKEHIVHKRCRSKDCKALLTYSIDSDKCTGCTVCARNCPEKAISGEKKEAHLIDQNMCIKCSICFEVCKFEAVVVA